MSFKNYRIPLDFSEIMEAEKADHDHKKSTSLMIKRTESIKKSVDEHIELILTTHQGEYKHNSGYGFVLWDKEFENFEIEKFNTHNNPKQDIEIMVSKVLNKYEPRLKNIQVEVLFIFKKVFKGKKIKYYVDLNVKGTFTNKMEEPYERSFQFAMGPLLK
jgi:phage baseplate assembly protein W